MTQRIITATALVALWCTSAQAEVSGIDRVRELDDRATVMFSAGDYEAALATLRRAQELRPASARLYNMALCEENLGRPRLALALFLQFIDAENAPDDRRQSALQHIEDLQQTLADSEEELADEVPDDHGEQPSTEPAEASDWTTAPREGPAPRRGPAPAAFFALVGVTAATGLFAIVTGSIAIGRHNDWLELSLDHDEAALDKLQRQGRALTISTDALIGVTAAGAIASLVLGLLTRWSSEERAGRGLSLSWLGHGAALDFSGRF